MSAFCANTIDMFGGPFGGTMASAAFKDAPERIALKVVQHRGLAKGHAQAERAAQHAGEAWREAAYRAFVNYAARGERFTTEDVREDNPQLPPPPDKRAWGHIALRAKREGVVRAVSWVRAKSETVHGMVVTQWVRVDY